MNRSIRARNPFRMAYFALLILLTGALALVLMLNTQQATASNLAAQTALGTTFTYQGKLNDGNNPANGTYDFQFSLFDVGTGSAPIGAPVTVNGVNVQQGVFTVQLDFGASAFTGAPRWLGISVRPANTGDFAPLNPRQAISPAPYAIYADSAGNATTASSVPWTGITGKPDAGSITAVTAGPGLTGGGNTGNVTLGLDFGAAGTVAGDGLNITSNAASGHNYGIAGSSKSPGGYGVYGRNDAEIISLSGFALGVYGYSNALGGVGVQGVAGSNIGSYGVSGYVTSTFGAGVFGRNYAKDIGTSCCAAGIFGVSNAVGGRGVEGQASAATGNGFGVAGFSKALHGVGIYGESQFTQTVSGVDIPKGVWGLSGSVSGAGVYGTNTTYSSKTGPSGSWAGYFVGNVNVSGNLTKAAGSFKIDHPLEPENKYLYHSFVESPDMMNIYNGNVLLDANGEALVQMPAWFEALNMEFRYQLTAIGAPGPNLYIAQEMTNNQFKIAGGTANMKVSWQVTGIRHDPYAQAHRIPVEEDKPVGERGSYLYPAEYVQPEARGLNHQPAAAKAADASGNAAAAQAGAQQAQPTENK